MTWVQYIRTLNPLRCWHIYKNGIKLNTWQHLNSPVLLCTKPSLSQTPTNKPMRLRHLSLTLTTQLKEAKKKKKKKKKISHVLFFSLSSLISNHRVFRTVHVPKFKSRLLLSLSCACNCNDLAHFFLFRLSLFPRRGVSLFFYLSYIYLSIYIYIYIYTLIIQIT